MTNTLRVALFFSVSIALAHAAREPVLKQIDLPHNYYFREMYLPQAIILLLVWGANYLRNPEMLDSFTKQ